MDDVGFDYLLTHPEARAAIAAEAAEIEQAALAAGLTPEQLEHQRALLFEVMTR